MNYDNYLEDKRILIEQSLDEYLPNAETIPNHIHKSMRHSVFAGGKRLRPVLTLITGEFFGTKEDELLPFACAIEMIHTYSLIHDDLPALDNDDKRRGKPTNHVIYGEDIAILAGDALLNYSFELMLESSLNYKYPYIGLKAAREISKASGTSGMIGGQVVDLEMEKNRNANIENVSFIHENKTGALFNASVRAGAIIGEASSNDLNNITNYAQKLGLAFQVVDDILDIKGDEQKLGKSLGKDEESDKATYPKLIGLKESEQYAQKLYNEAINSISTYGEKAEPLRKIANKLVNRES
ncbi:polyprenyl synthetase family protein [Natranaerobius trueperi]|uniref:Farnesyl diphosphate synthase n=1 Tax=Natranaerobius trueperi TaxID=759412 RepID=A0A226BYK6_9FIRM|nr:farnesyl diphosphate synthase [Natranaerobius trueperi]OWZ84015.1 polyprenyl synthetase [Natranaerobius trueperi]